MGFDSLISSRVERVCRDAAGVHCAGVGAADEAGKRQMLKRVITLERCGNAARANEAVAVAIEGAGPDSAGSEVIAWWGTVAGLELAEGTDENFAFVHHAGNLGVTRIGAKPG
jgi:hypothetical protein